MTDSDEIAREYVQQYQALFDSLMKNPIIKDEEKLKLLNSFGKHIMKFVAAQRNNVDIDLLEHCEIIMVGKDLLKVIKAAIPDSHQHL